MPLTITTSPGKQFADGEVVTTAKLNQLGVPTFVITGTVDSGDFGPAVGVASSFTPGAYWLAFGTLTGNTYAATWSPAPVFPYVTGLKLSFKANVAFQALGDGVCLLRPNLDNVSVPILKSGKVNLGPLDIRAGDIVDVVYDGTVFQMQSKLSMPEFDSATAGMMVGGTVTDLRATGTNDYVVPSFVGADARFTTATQLAGRPLVVQFANRNTSSCRLTYGGFQAALEKSPGTPLKAGEIFANGVYTIVYDGTRFLIAGSAPPMASFHGYTSTAVQTVNAFVLTYATGDGPFSVRQGMTVTFKVTTAIDGTTEPTISIVHSDATIGQTPCKRLGGKALQKNDLIANQMATFVYNSFGSPFWELLTVREDGVSKAWANVTGQNTNGACTVVQGMNILSVTRSTSAQAGGLGRYDVLFTVPSPVSSANYAVIISCRPILGSANTGTFGSLLTSVASTAAGFTIQFSKASSADPASFYFAVYGV